jgi:hypothetical protein
VKEGRKISLFIPFIQLIHKRAIFSQGFGVGRNDRLSRHKRKLTSRGYFVMTKKEITPLSIKQSGLPKKMTLEEWNGSVD